MSRQIARKNGRAVICNVVGVHDTMMTRRKSRRRRQTCMQATTEDTLYMFRKVGSYRLHCNFSLMTRLFFCDSSRAAG
jgi:hypothetical protein